MGFHAPGLNATGFRVALFHVTLFRVTLFHIGGFASLFDFNYQRSIGYFMGRFMPRGFMLRHFMPRYFISGALPHFSICVISVLSVVFGSIGSAVAESSDSPPDFAALCRDDLGYRGEGWGHAVCVEHQRMIWEKGKATWQKHQQSIARAREDNQRRYQRFQDRPVAPSSSGQPNFQRLCRDEYGYDGEGGGMAQCMTRQRSLWNNDRNLWNRERQSQAEFVKRRHQAAKNSENALKSEDAKSGHNGAKPNFTCYCEKGSGNVDGTWGMAVCRQHQEMLWRQNHPLWVKKNHDYDAACRWD